MSSMLVRPAEILLVEDNAGDARLAQEALRECKVTNHLHVVTDGEQALAFLRQQAPYTGAVRPDIMLLDLNMPRKGGREVLTEMKADEQLRRIPVVILTSSAAEQDVLRSYDLGANCYVTKPVDLEQLTSIVRAIQEFWFAVVTLPPR